MVSLVLTLVRKTARCSRTCWPSIRQASRDESWPSG